MLSIRLTILKLNIIVALWCVVGDLYEIWNLLIVNSLLSLQYYWLVTYPSICLIRLCPVHHTILSVGLWLVHQHGCSVMTCPPACPFSYDWPTCMTAQLWPVHQHGCSVMTCMSTSMSGSVMTGPPAWLLSCDLSSSCLLSCDLST